MSAILEKIKAAEERRNTTMSRQRREGQRDAENTGEAENLWQRYDWRELNLASTPSPLRHWHD